MKKIIKNKKIRTIMTGIKKIMAVLVILSMNWSGLAAVGVTGSVFSDSEFSLGNVYSAGTMDLSLRDTDDNLLTPPLFTVSGMKRGDSQTKTVRVKRGGSMGFQYDFHFENVTGGLCGSLMMNAMLAGDVKYNGAVANTAFHGVPIVYSDPNDDWTLKLSLNSDAPENATCNFDLVVAGRQIGGFGFSSTKSLINNSISSGSWQICKTWTTQDQFGALAKDKVATTKTDDGEAQLSTITSTGALTLLPSGDSTPLQLSATGSGTGHWGKLTSDDGNTSYVYSTASDIKQDLYDMGNTTQTGTINSVTIHSKMSEVADSTVTAGANSADAGTDNPAIGSVAWPNPENITAVGSPYATANVGSGLSTHYLVATNYGFNIPTTATIKGIQVMINRNANQNWTWWGIKDAHLYLVKNNLIQTSGSDKASSSIWSTSMATANYGSSSDSWSNSWTPTDINSGNFGVALSVNDTNFWGDTAIASVDYIKISVTYALPASGKIYIKTNGVEYGNWQTLTTSYADSNPAIYTINPQTGLAWTWDEINALQTGVAFKDATAGARATTIWAVVDYTTTTFNSSGTITSAQYPDANTQAVNWQSLSWHAATNSPTTNVALQYATSADGSSWASWTTATASTPIDLTSIIPVQYIRWQANLATANNQQTPVLQDVTACYSIPSNGNWVQDSQSDFNADTQDPSGNLDTSTNPGAVQLSTHVTGSGTTTLRPNANGDDISLSKNGSGGSNYDRVDEVDSDNTSYVYRSNSAYDRDLYALTDTTINGTITSVKVYMNVKVNNNAGNGDNAKTVIKTNSTEYTGSEIQLTTTYTVPAPTVYLKNPNTGNDWTWNEINNLQAGVSLRENGSSDSRCTQVWVEINYNTTGYYNSGRLESQSFNNGKINKWKSLNWNGNTPAGTSITLDVATSNDGTVWSAWQLASAISPIDISSLPESQFIKWRATLATNDTSKTPVLNDVTVSYEDGNAINKVKLNEFLPNPIGSDTQTGSVGEWVEIYNTGVDDVDLQGWYIKETAGNHTIPISAANTKDGRTTIGHSGASRWVVVYMNNTVIDNIGDTLSLYDQFGNLADSYTYNLCDSGSIVPTPGSSDGVTLPTAGTCETGIPENKSYARIPDGSGTWYDPIPTPGDTNELSEEEIEAEKNIEEDVVKTDEKNIDTPKTESEVEDETDVQTEKINVENVIITASTTEETARGVVGDVAPSGEKTDDQAGEQTTDQDIAELPQITLDELTDELSLGGTDGTVKNEATETIDTGSQTSGTDSTGETTAQTPETRTGETPTQTETAIEQPASEAPAQESPAAVPVVIEQPAITPDSPAADVVAAPAPVAAGDGGD